MIVLYDFKICNDVIKFTFLILIKDYVLFMKITDVKDQLLKSKYYRCYVLFQENINFVLLYNIFIIQQ